jgi:hypothetical protein
MSEEFDFERYWLGKFSNCLKQVAGAAIRDQIMEGGTELTKDSSRQEVVAWTRVAIGRLDDLTDDRQRHDIMTGCACQYPKENLTDVRALYRETGDLDAVQRMLQERFENFLIKTLELEGSLVDEIVKRGWGLAGVRQGDTIIATKIPKSGNLVEYFNESDPVRQRALYCHCPRVSELLQWQNDESEPLSPTYCYCGAGYYRGLWEEILDEPVRVEVLESVLQGHDVCKIAIYLPPDTPTIRSTA